MESSKSVQSRSEKPRQAGNSVLAFRNLPRAQADVGAERTLLGTILFYPASISEAVDCLEPKDLFSEANRTIYRAILELHEQRVPVEPEILRAHLDDRDLLQSVGGVSYLAMLDQNVAGSGISHYVTRIKAKALLRNLDGLCSLIHTKIQEGDGEGEELLGEAQRLLAELSVTTTGKNYERADAMLTKHLTRLENHEPGMKTGLADLDYMLGGLQRQDQILIVARPSMGKTALGITIGLNVARTGKPAGLFSLEMSADQIAGRIAGMWSNVSMHKMRTGRLERSDWAELTNARRVVEGLPFYVDETSGLTTNRLRARARRMCDDLGLQLILIDYIGLLRMAGRVENRNQEIGQISRDVKEMAKELNVPVIAMCQLSRKSEDRKEHEPMLSDLRDSGELEQNADVVIGIYREAYYNETDENRNRAALHILKHRNGEAPAKVEVCFLKEYMRFENLGV